MKKLVRMIKERYKLLSLGTACLAIGAVSTFAVVHAAIPAADGTIHGCRNSTTTLLRVIDDATQACDSSETGLNWDQKGVKGYAHITSTSGSPINGDFVLDANRNYHISNLHYTFIGFNDFQLCLTVSGNPKNVSLQREAVGGTTDNPRGSVKDENGWTASAAAVCDQVDPTTNVYIRSAAVPFFVTIF